MHSFKLLFSSLFFCNSILAATLARDTSESTTCTNSAADRSCWSDGFDASTNYYDEAPDTGVIREYWFNIENTTAAPDGVEMPVQLINGSFPGPTIIADWGDTVRKY
jgi:hypothetical protein